MPDALMNNGHPQPIAPPPPHRQGTEAIGWWLLLRAFASGCTAMTGVEAVSNGVSAFREPRTAHAHRTLAAIVGVLAILLGGISYLASAYGIMAMDQTQPGYQSVLSQLVGAVAGRGVFYYVAITSALCVLCLSANTSFVDFPRLCRLLAEDGFLPRAFAIVGRRLAFTVGILYLAVTAALLLIQFDGITDRLIPLFAIGAFLTFTLSQAGMVVHWRKAVRDERRARGRRVRIHLAINAAGATATAVALAIIVSTKFIEGGWITVVVIPCVIVLLRSVKRYYEKIHNRLRDEGTLDLRRGDPPFILVAMQEWNRLTDKALSFALRLSPDVMAVHLSSLEGPDRHEHERRLSTKWADDVEEPARRLHHPHPPRLLFLNAPYRRIHTPLLKLIKRLESENPGRMIAVLIPEVVEHHWWEYLLHTHRARRLRSALLEYGGPQVVIVTVPWHFREPKVEEAMTKEEIEEPFRMHRPRRQTGNS
jgi:hypothetical protein